MYHYNIPMSDEILNRMKGILNEEHTQISENLSLAKKKYEEACSNLKNFEILGWAPTSNDIEEYRIAKNEYDTALLQFEKSKGNIEEIKQIVDNNKNTESLGETSLAMPLISVIQETPSTELDTPLLGDVSSTDSSSTTTE